MSHSIITYIVDAFTDQPFKGNPAGVCLLENEITDALMLHIAKELGLSETAFVNIKKDKKVYPIRFFSPEMEIPLCGHATLAAAKVLMTIDPPIKKIRFLTKQNIELPITSTGELIGMEFPLYKTVPRAYPDALVRALGITEVINSVYNKETNILLLEIASSQTLKNIAPDYQALLRSHKTINGVLITARSEREDYDFESRYFWPWSGTNEDPVTGGTHTFLAPYWSERLHKTRMNSFQCSARTGSMEVEIMSSEKIIIKSSACIILKGEMRV